jgi:RNA polymerase-binding protein DksA
MPNSFRLKNRTERSRFMKKSEMNEYKEILTTLRARLRGDVSQLADEALKRNRQDASGDLSTMPIHMADIGSDNFEQDFTLTLLESEEQTLAKIETALTRIAEGTYGTCETCGEAIPKPRLQAIPYALRCVACAQKEEGERV